MKLPIKRAEAEIVLCRSKETGKLYYTLLENGSPLKYWAFDEMSETAKDFIGEIINAFDLGYDIRCQFPVEREGKKILVPKETAMYNEPGSGKSNSKVIEKFFVPSTSTETQEPKATEFGCHFKET